jgi:hypothetical protein
MLNKTLKGTDAMTNQGSASVDEPVWAAYVAIDWADQKHLWKIQAAAGGPIESGVLEHTPEAVEGFCQN